MQTGADSIEEFVISTIVEFAHCRRDDVVRETSLVDLGVDSLVVATLVTFVEAEYGCAFTSAQRTSLYSATRVDDVLLAVRHVVGSVSDNAMSTAPLDGRAL